MLMRRALLLRGVTTVCLCLLWLCASGGCDRYGAKARSRAPAVAVPASFVVHSAGGVALKTPPGWSSRPPGAAVMMLTSPPDPAAGGAVGAIRARVTVPPEASSLDRLVDLSIAGLRKGTRYFKLESREEDQSLGTMPATRITFSGIPKDSDHRNTWSATFAVVDGKQYTLTCTSRSTAWAYYDPIFRQIQASFRAD
jgi:hypothetical protein